ncbi:sigma 54-interacting transcriptional regulator [Mucilaginibacter rigui]|uniref:Sigma 54-interacting transcriptional regulator n=1 Tax=Mucilaginibacter rigui TaxID=534635 RepID=A0ABR7X5R3_9SPHI|nr:sigma 54-interacting transcriptional regulator [Mucilaginibacter rigui]MBD1385918.1 sigma 54-interacting transcriptional regulator [Mucilaginibacter rigui]
MGLNILVVEDQFIEANDLGNILREAGHTVIGTAKSVDQAMTILKKSTPDIVLLDIYLKGTLTGIDLAKTLGQENIPFIYISANSNESTLDLAKATHPHGFLVKPYRAKDIIVALDIASYRHRYSLELNAKHAKEIIERLEAIELEGNDILTKLTAVLLAVKPFIPFELVLIDLDIDDFGLSRIFGFERKGYYELSALNGGDLRQKLGLTLTEVNSLRAGYSALIRPVIRNSKDFTGSSASYKAIRKLFGIQSSLQFPLLSSGEPHMMISFYNTESDGYSTDHISLLKPVSDLLQKILGSVKKQYKGTTEGVSPYRSAVSQKDNPAFDHIIGNSVKLLAALEQVRQVASFDASVLILGETGVGKEGLVKAIHKLSSRHGRPLIRINCAAIPESLVESELFGHERGAFTGAFERRIGKFEQAQGGTIFLDEIGEMPLEVQTKLLRVIQEKELERVGGRTTIKIDVRIVAATNRDLYKDVAAGKFRIDLYYRINVFPINLAPLRERRDDIPLLVEHFLKRHSTHSANKKSISHGEMEKLIQYSWPGNIRELENIIERHALTTQSDLITFIDLPTDSGADYIDPDADKFQSIADLDKAHIIEALRKCNGKVSGKGGAAEMLQLPPTTLASKMKKLGIVWQYLLG